MGEIEQDNRRKKEETPVDPGVLRCMQMPLVTFAFGQRTYSAAAAAAGKVDLDKFTFTIDTINRLRSKLLATGGALFEV